ncbi:MAG: HNH endonuclease [Chloroflexota bacterium]|mgnify:CR=1 FL=1
MPKEWNFPKYPLDWSERSRAAKRRDGYRCVECGRNTGLHAHHIVPLSKGGSNDLSNLKTLCGDCHAKNHPHMQAQGNRWRIPRSPTNPASFQGLSFVFLLILFAILVSVPGMLSLIVIGALIYLFIVDGPKIPKDIVRPYRFVVERLKTYLTGVISGLSQNEKVIVRVLAGIAVLDVVLVILVIVKFIGR